jgi:histidyl-tRNA synthetase
MMSRLGASPDMWVLRVNDRVLLDAMLTTVVGVEPGSMREVAALVDLWEKYDSDVLAEQAAGAGLTEKQFTRLSEVLSAGPAVLEEIPDEVEQRSQLMRVLETDTRELFTFDPMIVQGL